MTMSKPIDLRVVNVTKAFYGVRAIDSVDLHVVGGEVHGLLGENGAGKSTLCSVLSGLYRPDSGHITSAGEHVEFRSPLDASAHGIGMVYQQFRLVDTFTVAQNIALGMGLPGGGRALVRVAAQIRALAEDYGLDVDPTALVWQLSVGEQQRVAILKQLFRGAELLILDEPTAVLAPSEVERLFDVVGAMTAKGHAVVLVSHKMDEVLDHTNTITVLRHGKNVGELVTADTTAAEVTTLMFGEQTGTRERPARSVADHRSRTPVLHVSALTVLGDRGVSAVENVSLDVHRGEIVGVAGLAGNGQRELHESIAGLRRHTSGTIRIGDVDCSRIGPGGRSKAGLGYVPEDRLGTGLAPGLSLEHNLVLKNYDRPPHAKRGVLSMTEIDATADALVARFDIRGARSALPVSLLSGGNQQKAVLARELTQPHEVMVAAAPTRGLDQSASDAVRSHLVHERNEGRGVLLFSEDLEEIVELSDIVLVMTHGRIVGRFSRAELDLEHLGLLLTGTDRAAS